MMAILSSCILAYLFYPVYEGINKKIKKKAVSALIVSVIIILIIIVPLSFMLFEISKESNVSYIVLKQKIAKGTLFEISCEDGLICSGVNKFAEFMKNPEVKFYLEDSLKELSTRVAKGAISFIVSIPKMILDIFITFFMVFFLLKDGEDIVKKFEKATPLNKKLKDRIFTQMHEITRAIIYGFFLLAVVQGIIGAITFSLFGVGSPIIWGVVITILALIPFVGAFLIWMPIALMTFFNGSLGAAIGITIGGVIMSSIDTFLKPKIVGNKANIHPILILLGFLGGIALLGPIGVIIGPLILSLLVTFVEFM